MITIDMYEDVKASAKLNSAADKGLLFKQDSSTVDWNCPSIETVTTGNLPDQAWFHSLTNPERVGKILEERAGLMGRDYWVLPAWQNLEAVVYGRRIRNDGTYIVPSSYCVKNLAQMQDMDFDLLSDPMILSMVHLIAVHKTRPILLEVEAPFSILAALMNPMDLYLCMEDGEQEALLIRLLHRIADATAEFIRACLEAGCRVISLADPAGTMDLLGEKCYGNYCGDSEIYLMKICRPYLKNGILHICRKMSLSLILADRVEAVPYHPAEDAKDHMDVLREMADDPEISFTGMTCIHSRKPDLKDSYILKIK